MKNRAWVSVLALAGVTTLALQQNSVVQSEICSGQFTSVPSQTDSTSTGSNVNTDGLLSSAPNCNDAGKVANASWAAWISGKSVSFQFHFLDLLELLHDESESEHFRHTPQ